jgi:basic membrane protein A and related proteins
MRKHPGFWMAIAACLALVLGACQAASPSASASQPASEPASEAPSVPSVDYRVCMVTDVGGIDDNSFNENAWKGMQDAQAQLGVEVRFLESRSEEDYARNVNQHISDGCQMIVTVGFLLGDVTQAAAEANPDVRFAIVDFAYDPALPNVEGLVYNTAEAAMLAGYASAFWSRSEIMGTFGGINIGAPVTDFMDGFTAGMNYWNQESGEAVRMLGGRDPSDPQSGTFTGNFESTDDAKNITLGMLQEGADVVLPVGGPIGEGTFAAIDEQGVEAVGLGVDVDWTLTVPEFSHLMLTHIIKKIDVSVTAAVERGLNDEAPQPVFVSTLENGGVDLGPFHDYEGDFDQTVLDGIQALRDAIIAGDVTPSDYYSAQ